MKFYEFLLQRPDVCQAVTSICAVGVAIMALLFTIFSLIMQRGHYIKSLQPSCNITCSDYKNVIRIELHNFGHGFMRVEAISILNEQTKSTHRTIKEYFPKEIPLEYYSVDLSGCIIGINGHKVLVQTKELKPEEKESIKEILRHCTLCVTYSDVYNKSYYREKNLYFLVGKLA